MKIKGPYHLIPFKNTWIIKRHGSIKATRVFKNRLEATTYRKRISIKHKTKFVMHARNGQVKKNT